MPAPSKNLVGWYPIFFQVHALKNLRWHPQNHFSGCRLNGMLSLGLCSWYWKRIPHDCPAWSLLKMLSLDFLQILLFLVLYSFQKSSLSCFRSIFLNLDKLNKRQQNWWQLLQLTDNCLRTLLSILPGACEWGHLQQNSYKQLRQKAKRLSRDHVKIFQWTFALLTKLFF